MACENTKRRPPPLFLFARLPTAEMLQNGMKTSTWLVLLAFFSILLSGRLNGQGPLVPPGPPAPTLKTLEQTEPRRPISSVPFTISEPGSYYLTQNLHFTATSGHAIVIAASDVTLDLMGFTLSSSSTVEGDAIALNGGLRNIEVRNGVIAGNTTVTISGLPETWTVNPAGFRHGVGAATPAASGGQFRNLRISGCRLYGLEAGQQSLVEQVTAIQNGKRGITVDRGNVTNCRAFSNGGGGIVAQSSVITNCAAEFNAEAGISAGNGSIITNSTARRNGSDGIDGRGGVVAFCAARENNRNNGLGEDIKGSSPNTSRTGNYPAP